MSALRSARGLGQSNRTPLRLSSSSTVHSAVSVDGRVVFKQRISTATPSAENRVSSRNRVSERVSGRVDRRRPDVCVRASSRLR
jgi:hypothetical protein